MSEERASPDGEGDLPRVLLANRQDLPLDARALAAVARACLIAENAADVELSLSFVGSEEMADLNARYAGEQGPTDVLSFPLDEEEEGGARVLGDVVVAPAVAARNNPDLAAELRLLVAHGTLHLLGYDHETPQERRAMWTRQERYSGVRSS